MRRQLVFILLLLAMFPASLLAVPASPDAIDLEQPDGGKIKGRMRGDEFQNWTETEDTRHTVLRDKATGYWEYAEQTPDGSLRGSGIRVLPDGRNSPSHIPKGLKPPRNKQHQKMIRQMLQETYQERVSAVSPSGGPPASSFPSPPGPGDWVPAPVSGTKNLLVILVSFSNKAISTPASAWADSSFNLAVKSVAKFYNDNSFNSMTMSPVAHTKTGNPPGVISVTIPSAHPNYEGNYTFAGDQTWCNSALQQAAPYVNFNSFDANGDGKLDTSEIVIYFVAAGYEASGSALTPSIWAHAWWTGGTGLTAGTKNVQRWGMNGEMYNATTRMPMGVVAHELGHQICGLPDLYDISGQNEAMGEFSLMAGGSWGGDTGEISGTTPVTLDAWSREYLGWSAPATPAAAGIISLEQPLASPAAGYKLIIPATSSTEYFLVENRYPVNWDLGLKKRLGSNWQGGMLITHIDITAGTVDSNDINSYDDNVPNPGHQGIVPVQASTVHCDMLSATGCRGHATTLFYEGNNPEWSITTSPNSNYYDDSATDFSLLEISAPGTAMTAKLLLAPPADRTVSILKSGNGAGIVVATPGGISCGATCSATIYDATTVQLHASPEPGSYFSGWAGGGCAGTGDCTFMVSADTVITADFTNPLEVNIGTKPASLVNSPTAIFTFTSLSAGTTFECSVDGSPYASCTSPYTTPTLGEGLHTFTVRARDGLGNTSVSPANHTWTITQSSNNVGVTIGAGTTYYSTLSSALASLLPGANATIRLKALEFSERLVLDVADSVVTLLGGYDGSLATPVGMTTIEGGLTISGGALTVDRLTIK